MTISGAIFFLGGKGGYGGKTFNSHDHVVFKAYYLTALHEAQLTKLPLVDE